MKAAALTLVVALSLSASAFAQTEARNEREYRDSYDHFVVGLRNSLPTGTAFSGVDWDDLISGGIGLELQYSQLSRASSWVYGGWYVGLSVDSYGGRSSTLSSGGVTADIRTGRLNTAALEFGGRLRQNFNGFHLDESVGVGPLMYMKQEFDVRNGGPENLELIKSSVSYLLDVNVRVGAPIGKNIELGLGVGLDLKGAPGEGDDVSGLNFRPMLNIVFGLTLDIGL
ncbi:MAG: hypothetical protein JO332_02120 [Planctomycetaceae bacterium]|nr:hypothetical protein [Planctomycetaceae bacterium]